MSTITRANEIGSGGKVRERRLRCLGVALFSVDRFKRINEQYGQAVGDQVLAEVKHAIATSQPAGDIAIRWDADGFLVMLPNANEKQARAFAERVKSALALVPLPNGLVVSVTVGTAELTAGESIQDTIGRADEVLYRRSGKSESGGVIDELVEISVRGSDRRASRHRRYRAVPGLRPPLNGAEIVVQSGDPTDAPPAQPPSGEDIGRRRKYLNETEHDAALKEAAEQKRGYFLRRRRPPIVTENACRDQEDQ